MTSAQIQTVTQIKQMDTSKNTEERQCTQKQHMMLHIWRNLHVIVAFLLIHRLSWYVAGWQSKCPICSWGIYHTSPPSQPPSGSVIKMQVHGDFKPSAFHALLQDAVVRLHTNGFPHPYSHFSEKPVFKVPGDRALQPKDVLCPRARDTDTEDKSNTHLHFTSCWTHSKAWSVNYGFCCLLGPFLSSPAAILALSHWNSCHSLSLWVKNRESMCWF